MPTTRITYAPWGASIDELCRAAQLAEAAGAQAVWLSEFHRSSMTVAAAVAAATSRSIVGSAVSLAFTRSPLVTALEALDIDELSAGRFVLGLGTGVRRLNEDWHGAVWGRPVQHLREVVAAIRAFVAHSDEGRPIAVDGEFERMQIRGYRRPYPPIRREIPIYLAGVGPNMLALAGEVGQGWISHELCSPAWIERVASPALSQGLNLSRRTSADFEVVASACCSVNDDRNLARRWAAGVVGFYASVATYHDFFAFHGFGAEHHHIVAQLRSGTPADRLGQFVTDDMIDTFTLAGTPREVQAKMTRYDATANGLKLSPPTHGMSDVEVRSAQSALIDLLAES